MMGMVDILEDYEAGYLDPRETLELFAELIRTGQARSLGGPCGRIAPLLIEAGYITPAEKITLEGYAAARHAEPTEDQRLLIGGSDEPVPGPFAVPNVDA
jgi:hypothetical protein